MCFVNLKHAYISNVVLCHFLCASLNVILINSIGTNLIYKLSFGSLNAIPSFVNVISLTVCLKNSFPFNTTDVGLFFDTFADISGAFNVLLSSIIFT